MQPLINETLFIPAVVSVKVFGNDVVEYLQDDF